MSDEIKIVDEFSGEGSQVATRCLTYGELDMGDKFTTELDHRDDPSTLKMKVQDGHVWLEDGQQANAAYTTYIDSTPVIRYDIRLQARPQPPIEEK